MDPGFAILGKPVSEGILKLLLKSGRPGLESHLKLVDCPEDTGDD